MPTEIAKYHLLQPSCTFVYSTFGSSSLQGSAQLGEIMTQFQNKLALLINELESETLVAECILERAILSFPLCHQRDCKEADQWQLNPHCPWRTSRSIATVKFPDLNPTINQNEHSSYKYSLQHRLQRIISHTMHYAKSRRMSPLPHLDPVFFYLSDCFHYPFSRNPHLSCPSTRHLLLRYC